MRFQQESEGRTLTPSSRGFKSRHPNQRSAGPYPNEVQRNFFVYPVFSKSFFTKDSFYFGCKRSARSALMALRFCCAKNAHFRRYLPDYSVAISIEDNPLSPATDH